MKAKDTLDELTAKHLKELSRLSNFGVDALVEYFEFKDEYKRIHGSALDKKGDYWGELYRRAEWAYEQVLKKYGDKNDEQTSYVESE